MGVSYNINMLNIYDKTSKKELKKYSKDIKKYYNLTLKTLKLNEEFDLSLVIVGPKKIKEINRDYRNKDQVTDVISFACIDGQDDYSFEENYNLGDIFINVDRVKSQAKEYKHSIKREYCFLFVHGLLHLLGYDHMNKKDEKKMFDLQKRIIGDLK